MKDRARLGVAALSLSAAALVGCGVLPQSQLSHSTGATAFRTASAASRAKFVLNHGLGWEKAGTKPLINDLTPGLNTKLSLGPNAEPPAKVDLRAQMSPIADQGRYGSCTAFAIAKGLKEFLELKQIRDHGGDVAKDFVPLSAAYLWFDERAFGKNQYVDTGSQMFVGMNMLTSDGVPSEASYPYPTREQQRDPWYTKYFLSATPSANIDHEAAQMAGGSVRSITKLSELKESLAEGYPVVYGFVVFSSIDDVSENGILPMPNVSHDEIEGGHATVAVGYDDERQVIILKNSWGSKWGDKGYFYMPYRYFDTELGFVHDGWTMRE